MGEAKRRKAAAHAKLDILEKPGVKGRIAAAVRSVQFPLSLGGMCLYRVAAGMYVLKGLGLPAEVRVGSMLYRAGPDPIRDTLAFCGPGNIGCWPAMESGLMGHFWISLGDDIVDFSAGDWKGLTPTEGVPDDRPDLAANAAVDRGPIQWDATPPDYYWQQERTLTDPWKAKGEPAIGEVWYGGFKAKDLPQTTRRVEMMIGSALDMLKPALPILRRNIERMVAEAA
jgi:hypothetical protein